MSSKTSNRIMFINPCERPNIPPVHMPLELAQLMAIVNEQGYEGGLLDCNIYKLDRELVRVDLKDEAKEKPFGIFYIGGMLSTYAYQKDLYSFMKKDHPKTILVVGGECGRTVPLEIMQSNKDIDIIVYGEAENVILNLIKHVEDKDWSKIKGIMYRDGDKTLTTEPQPCLTDEEMDALPYPSWELLPLEKEKMGDGYFKYSPIPLSPESILSKRRLEIVGSKGCWFNCIHCTEANKPFHRHSPKYIVDMLKAARYNLSIDFVSFMDPCGTTNDKKFMLELCKLLEDANLPNHLKWGCAAYPNFDEETLTRMRDAGCSYIIYHFGSVDNRVLEESGELTAFKMQRALDLTSSARITPMADIMMGYPSEDTHSAYATAQFLINNNIWYKPPLVTPIPKTRLFENTKDIIKKEYETLEDYMLELQHIGRMHVNLTHFNDAELLGLQELVLTHDLKRIKKLGIIKKEMTESDYSGPLSTSTPIARMKSDA